MEVKKNKWFNWELTVLACAAVVVLLCCIVHPLQYVNAAVNLAFYEYVDIDQVESVSGFIEELDADQRQEFIWLVNSAKYRGNDVGYGTTPEFGVNVHLRDGSIFTIEEYGDHNFLVCHRIDGRIERHYFIESEMLDAYMTECRDGTHPWRFQPATPNGAANVEKIL